VWVENKLYAREGPRQLEDQWRALRAEKPILSAQHLVAIVLTRDDVAKSQRKARVPAGFDVRVLRWLEIKDLVIAAGADAGGQYWCDLPSTPSEFRELAALRAFLWWIEQEEPSRRYSPRDHSRPTR